MRKKGVMGEEEEGRGERDEKRESIYPMTMDAPRLISQGKARHLARGKTLLLVMFMCGCCCCCCGGVVV